MNEQISSALNVTIIDTHLERKEVLVCHQQKDSEIWGQNLSDLRNKNTSTLTKVSHVLLVINRQGGS